jgi:hypothetical protein
VLVDVFLRSAVGTACLLLCKIAYNPERTANLFSCDGKGADVLSEQSFVSRYFWPFF